MRRRWRHRHTSRLRFLVSHQCKILLDSLQSQLKEMASDSKNGLLFILEGLAGLLGGRTVLEAARWQQGRIVRDVEAESNTRRKKKKPNKTPFLVKVFRKSSCRSHMRSWISNVCIEVLRVGASRRLINVNQFFLYSFEENEVRETGLSLWKYIWVTNDEQTVAQAVALEATRWSVTVKIV
ncbi:hypothetical protein RB195_023124 [Necator americanus]|uniref:Uncharacterized protein n=1 Tax=Necator americanus TaxID=51031 RepID=A0ABR1EHZ0_NECAM